MAREVVLLDASAAWRWQVVTAPRLASQIGALAISGLDVVADRAEAPTEVLGPAGAASARWPFAVDGDGAVIPPATPEHRIAAAFGITTFVLDATHRDLEMLELRLRYADGVAVWLNGIEIVRQALPRGAPNVLATRPHGPEWETFYVPVAPGMLRLGDNALAIEVHPSGRRDAPTLAAELVARRDRGIVRGPIVADATDTTAMIAVETDPDVTARLEWRLAGDAAPRVETSPAGRQHRFALSALPPNAQVTYRVIAGASQSPQYTLHTMPRGDDMLRIGIYGDVRGGHATHRRLVEHMLREGLDLVAVTGDMVLRGSDEADWQRFFAVTAELLGQVPYFPAVGNHDLGWGGGEREELFGLPAGPPGRPAGAYWYSRDVANVHLVFLDSNSYELAEQEAWLEQDLTAARARKVRAIIVFTHDGPYARGYHGGNAIARDRYVPILTRHRVDLVFSGHDHLYQRGEHRGLRYVVTGGGGASLYGIRCGVPGRPRCKIDDGMQAIAREHHYIVLAIGRDMELCTRRVDGTLLERCVRYALSSRQGAR